MSTPTHGRYPTRRVVLPAGLLLAALLVVGLAGGGRSGVAAQDASPPATPVPTCTPAVGDGAMAGMDMASPGASPAATPEPVGTPADAETAAAVVAAAENVVACYNAGDVEAFLGLVTDRFILDDLGSASREDAASELSGEAGIVPLADLAVDAESALVWDDGRVSVDVTYTQFDYQFVAARWYFVMSGSDYLLDDEQFETPQPDVDFVTIIQASIAADEGSTLVWDQSTSVAATDAIIVQINNAGGEEHEFALVMLPAGTALNEDGTLPEGLATYEDISADPGATLVGYVAVAGGGLEAMALIDLPVGVYALIDITDGTVLPLTVTEPEG